MTKLDSEWVDNRPFTQEKLKNFGGKKKSIMVFLKKAYRRVNYQKPARNKFKSTGKEIFLVDNKSEESWGKLVLKNC